MQIFTVKHLLNLQSRRVKVALTLLLVGLIVLVVSTRPTHAAPLVPAEPSTTSVEQECYGTASVSGTVVDLSGESASYIEVVISRSPYVDHFGREMCGRARTNEQGDFTIDGIGSGELFLHVWFRSQEEGPEQTFGPPPMSITFVDGEAIQLEEPLQLERAQFFAQASLSGELLSESEASIMVMLRDGEDDCPQEIDHFGLHSEMVLLAADGKAYIGNLYPGTYCVAAVVPAPVLDDPSDNVQSSISDPIQFELPVDAQMIDLGILDMQMPSKRITGSLAYTDGDGLSDVKIVAENVETYELLETTTNATGTFEFFVRGGSWEIEIIFDRSLGFLPQSTYTVTFTGDEQETVTVPVEDVQKIDSVIVGRVLGADGEQIVDWEAISVTATNTNTGHGTYRPINASGYFTLPVIADSYTISADIDTIFDWTADSKPLPFTPFDIEVDSGVPLTLDDILLGKPQVTFSVMNVEEDGPFHAFYVLYGPYDNDNPMPAACASLDSEPDLSSVEIAYNYTEIEELEDGQISGLIAGTYCLYLHYMLPSVTYIPPFVTSFEIVDADTLVELGSIEYANSRKSITGTVTWPDGVPVEGVEIRAQRATFKPGLRDVVAAKTDANGHYELGLDPDEWAVSLISNKTPQTSALRLFSQVYEKDITFTDNGDEEAKTLDFVVKQQTATISGTILKPDGTPAVGVTAWVHANSDQFEASGVSAVVDPVTAIYELSVPGGTWNVAYYLYPSPDDMDLFNEDFADSDTHVVVTVEDNSTISQDLTLTADEVIRYRLVDNTAELQQFEYSYLPVITR